MANVERTGWRDAALTGWHWRHDLLCRAAGVRFLMLEYNRARPVAVIDYRRYEDGVPNIEHPIYRAIADLAGDLPFCLAYYDQGFGFYLMPVNHAAREKLLGKGHVASEDTFVRWLWNIRAGRSMRPARATLNTSKPLARPDRTAGVPSLLELDGTLWMGQEISRRHREWGPDAPAVDLDYLLIDNNTARPVALVEYKHAIAGVVALGGASIVAQAHFADERVPFFVVRYWQDGEGWRFQPLLPEGAEMSETDWVDRLQAMRRAAA